MSLKDENKDSIHSEFFSYCFFMAQEKDYMLLVI